MDEVLENRLRELIEGNSEANRSKWAKEAKEWTKAGNKTKQGKKVIGVMTSYVPEEVISAAGMIPWRITGTWRENVDRARVYRAVSTMAYPTHVLESVLSGELDFLDGIVTSDQDQDLKCLWDVLVYVNKMPWTFCLQVPLSVSNLNYRFYAGEIRRLTKSLEDYSGQKISDESIHSSIITYNKMRSLLSQVYELRKRQVPPLSGAEVLGITTAAQVMPKEKFIQELESLLPYLETREANVKKVQPRILLVSDMLDHPGYLRLIEEHGLVAMDDLDTGVRYFIQNVDTNLTDPANALAKRYLGRHGVPRMADWAGQMDQILKWTQEYKIDGVVFLPLVADYCQRFREPNLRERLQGIGVPSVSLEREYCLANVGQLRTRIGAFMEMIAKKETVGRR